MARIEAGTVSHGTLRTEDLVPAFAAELDAVCDPSDQAARELIDEADDVDHDSEDAVELVDELQSKLNEYAPDGMYFGSHEGDASDFGWWQAGEGYANNRAAPPPLPPRRKRKRTTEERLHSMVREHEAEERPFDPEAQRESYARSHHFAVNPRGRKPKILTVDDWTLKELARITTGRDPGAVSAPSTLNKPERFVEEMNQKLRKYPVQLDGTRIFIARDHHGDSPYDPSGSTHFDFAVERRGARGRTEIVPIDNAKLWFTWRQYDASEQQIARGAASRGYYVAYSVASERPDLESKLAETAAYFGGHTRNASAPERERARRVLAEEPILDASRPKRVALPEGLRTYLDPQTAGRLWNTALGSDWPAQDLGLELLDGLGATESAAVTPILEGSLGGGGYQRPTISRVQVADREFFLGERGYGEGYEFFFRRTIQDVKNEMQISGDWVAASLRPNASAPERERARRVLADEPEEEFDKHAADELRLYIDNDRRFSPDSPEGMGRSVAANMLRKMRKSKYDPTLAIKGWMHVVDAAAKEYVRENQSSLAWHQMFPPATRRAVARELAKDFHERAQAGEYEHVKNPDTDPESIHLDEPDEHGRHPRYKHLVMFEIEPHYGSYILTAQGHDGSALISADDAAQMFEDQLDDGFAYLTDEYLELLADDEPE